MDRLIRDLRLAVRALTRNPGFAATALLTIALGIGANTAMFSVVNGILLRPLPYPRPDRLVRVYQASAERSLPRASISAPDFDDWRSGAESFSSMAAYWSSVRNLTGRGDPAELPTTWVSEDFFRVLGARAGLGRTLAPEDVRRADRAAVISDALWRRRFGSDPGVIGSTITLNGEPFTVLGVMPGDFGFPTRETEVWIPHSLISEEMIPKLRQVRYLAAIGRLRPGVTLEQANAEISSIAARLADQYPDSNGGWGQASAVGLQESMVGDVGRALVVVLAAVGFVLLIVCANLANLLLARSTSRSREMAIRSALGAGRRELATQHLTESLVLAVCGGALGVVLSVWGVRAILSLGSDTLPRAEGVGLDARVIGFGLLLAVLTGVLFGLVPALRASGTDPQQALRAGRGAVGGRQRLRGALVVAEVALAVVLVIGAGLMTRSFAALRSVDPGFEPEQVLAVSLQLGIPPDLSPPETVARIIQRKDEIIARVREIPGVQAVGSIKTLPLRGEGEPFEIGRPDRPDPSGGLRVDARFVSADYFRAMGIPLRSGSSFPERAAEGETVGVVISETTARRLFPGEEAVGRDLSAGGGPIPVIGVVGDVRQMGLDQEPEPVVYLWQNQAARVDMTLVVRTVGDPASFAAPVREAIRALDPDQPIRSLSSLDDVVSESIARDRFFTVLFGLFGGVGAAAGGGGDLRGAGVLRGSADAGDRGEDGAGRPRLRRAADGGRRRDAPGGGRGGAGHRSRAPRHPRTPGAAVRRERHRPAHLPGRAGASGGRRGPGGVPPRPPRHPRGPQRRAAGGIARPRPPGCPLPGLTPSRKRTPRGLPGARTPTTTH